MQKIGRLSPVTLPIIGRVKWLTFPIFGRGKGDPPVCLFVFVGAKFISAKFIGTQFSAVPPWR